MQKWSELTRKLESSRARGSGRRRFVPSAGFDLGSGGLRASGSVWFGAAAEGYLVAEGAELADVVADLAGGVAVVVVVVGAEVPVAGAGVGQQHVEDAHLGV